MRYLSLLFLLFLISCDDQPVIHRDSAGRLNDILVIMENSEWEGAIGDSIRKHLARPIDGLIREEPLFTLNHIKPESFDGMLRKTRNYLQIKTSDKNLVTVEQNKHATPQIGVTVNGRDNTSIAATIADQADQIIDVYLKGEVEEKQFLMRKTPLNTSRVNDIFGVRINVPRTYHFARNRRDDDFVWIRRPIAEGTMDIMIYEVPYNRIQRDENTVQDIVAVRDSIGAVKIPVDEPGVFITEKAFSPLLNESQIDGRFAFETKGIWEVKNLFMSGPFINYAVYNEQKNNWLVLEGYVSAPNTAHRNYLFELESILKSVQFPEE